MPTIRNCRFAFKCTRTWESLIDTGRPDVRFCGECQQEVHFCHTDAQLAHAIRMNRCVAIGRPAASDEEIHVMGLPA
jgi:hypothetical protein